MENRSSSIQEEKSKVWSLFWLIFLIWVAFPLATFFASCYILISPLAVYMDNEVLKVNKPIFLLLRLLKKILLFSPCATSVSIMSNWHNLQLKKWLLELRFIGIDLKLVQHYLLKIGSQSKMKNKYGNFKTKMKDLFWE